MSTTDSRERLFRDRPEDPDASRKAQQAWNEEHVALKGEAAKHVATGHKQVTTGDCFQVMELAATATAMLEEEGTGSVSRVVLQTECDGFVTSVSQENVVIEFETGAGTESRSFRTDQFSVNATLHEHDLVKVRSTMCLVAPDSDTNLTEQELDRFRSADEREKRIREAAKTRKHE